MHDGPQLTRLAGQLPPNPPVPPESAPVPPVAGAGLAPVPPSPTAPPAVPPFCPEDAEVSLSVSPPHATRRAHATNPTRTQCLMSPLVGSCQNREGYASAALVRSRGLPSMSFSGPGTRSFGRRASRRRCRAQQVPPAEQLPQLFPVV